jgi:hypothetical protein
LEAEEFEIFIQNASEFLRDKDKNLLQIVLTQKARLQEIEGDILMNQLSGNDIDEAKAHVKGALSYVLSQLSHF